MTQHDIHSSLAVFDYSDNKLCDLYDSQNDLAGQAYDIERTINMTDGIKQLCFSIPYMVDEEKNFRWKYIKSEYIIRLIYNGKTEWYIAHKPVKQKDRNGVVGEVTCDGFESTLKTKNIYKEFDDENGIGTLSELADKVLAGTGWHRGYTDPMLEQDGTTEKIRSLKAQSKQGALGLITTLCNLFKCYPVYDSNNKTVAFYNFNNRDQVLEGTVGRDMEALTVKYNSSDLITRLYVEGEYGDNGYVGIDTVNPTHLNYIFNFDYFRELGLFTARHDGLLSAYTMNAANIKSRIMSNTSAKLEIEDKINEQIGQCKLAIYYQESGFLTPRYIYGSPTTDQQLLHQGDEVIVINTDAEFRYDTITTTPEALMRSNDYGIVKFITKAAGKFGALEVQKEAKEKEIANLQRKINNTTKEDKIAEYTAEITRLEAEIERLFYQDDGMDDIIYILMNPAGRFYQRHQRELANDALQLQLDDIESDFIIVMGDMLRDGYWSNQNYIPGQEQHLYDDAVERMKVLSRPTVDYTFSLIRLHKDFGIPLEDFKLNAIFRLYDPELDINDNLFITKITIGIDNEDVGKIEVSNRDITINANDLGSLLSRMSQLSDLIEQKNTLYERAKAISQNGTLYADRLNGQIDVLKNQLLSTVSNWHTDDQGNILFEAADGGSAMMLCGAGFMIANSKDDNDEWLWRTFGTGEGFTADEIVAGFISAERIEAGSISTEKVEPGFGGSLVITGNPSITALNEAIAPEFIENHAYTAGEHISQNGVFYVFNRDFPGGTFAEAAEYLSRTDVATEIELMPDRIISYVGSKGYGKTYVQLTDPTLDSDKQVAIGDYWIVATDAKTWGTLKQSKWEDVKQKIYDALASGQTVYYWNGTKWVRIYDTAVVTEAYTRITQTQNMILQEAERAEGQYIKKTEQLQTADAIVTSAKEYVDGTLVNYSTTEQTASQIATTISTALGSYYTKTETANEITTTLSTALGDYYTKSETASQIDTTISNKLGDYYTKTETASQINSTISTKLGNYYTKTETASQITSTISTKLGDYYTKSETASKINTTISDKLGNYYTKTETNNQITSTISTKLGNYSTTTQTSSMISLAVGGKQDAISGIEITSSGINITGSKYLKLGSSGTLDIDTSNFKINSTSQYLISGGWRLDNYGLSYKWKKDGRDVYASFTQDDGIFHISSDLSNPHAPDGGVDVYFTRNESEYYGIGNEGCIIFNKVGTGGMVGSKYCKVKEIWCQYLHYDSNPIASSRSVKHDIKDMPNMGDKIDKLNPVTFRYNDQPDQVRMGLIYEDTVSIIPEICIAGKETAGIDYVELIPVLLKEVQSLRKRVSALEQS